MPERWLIEAQRLVDQHLHGQQTCWTAHLIGLTPSHTVMPTAEHEAIRVISDICYHATHAVSDVLRACTSHVAACSRDSNDSRRSLTWRSELGRCSSARMTWLTAISASSTATQKLYTGWPLERRMTKSPSVSVFHVTLPRMASSMEISVS